MNITANTKLSDLEATGLRLRFIRRGIQKLHQMPNKKQCHIKELQQLVNEWAELEASRD
jgi:hypothetical protein